MQISHSRYLKNTLFFYKISESIHDNEIKVLIIYMMTSWGTSPADALKYNNHLILEITYSVSRKYSLHAFIKSLPSKLMISATAFCKHA